MTAIDWLRNAVWSIGYYLFPPTELWRVSREVDYQEQIHDFEDDLQGLLETYDGDVEQYSSEIRESYRAEMDRGSTIDAKASNFVGNIGIVLGILSLIPVFAIVLGVEEQNLFDMNSWLEIIIFALLLYAVSMLLLSAFYSVKAVRLRQYSVYDAASSMKARLEDNNPDREEKVREILQCKKRNEIVNRRKTNTVAVATSLSQNGLISLALIISIVVIRLSPVGLFGL